MITLKCAIKTIQHILCIIKITNINSLAFIYVDINNFLLKNKTLSIHKNQ